MFNADMLGWRLPNTEMTLGMKDRYVADWLLTIANGITEQYVPGIKAGSSASCCSDHQVLCPLYCVLCIALYCCAVAVLCIHARCVFSPWYCHATPWPCVLQKPICSFTLLFPAVFNPCLLCLLTLLALSCLPCPTLLRRASPRTASLRSVTLRTREVLAATHTTTKVRT